MGDWPALPLLADLGNGCISTWSQCSLFGLATIAPAGAAWPAANDAIFVPFRLPAPRLVYKMACGTGTLTTGNFDLGIYDEFGNRLVSTGSTAKTTASSERVIDVTDTLLLPGLYYMAMAANGTDAYVATVPTSAAAVPVTQLMGVRKMATAFALPATATLATVTAAYVPLIAAYVVSV